MKRRREQLRRRHGRRWRDQRHPGRARSRHVGLQGLPGREGADHRRQDGPARQDLPHQRLLDVHRVAEVHRVRPASQHRDPDLHRGRQRRGRGRRLRGHPDQEAPLRQRGHLHGLHDLRRVLPGPGPRSVQPGAVGQQGRSTSTSPRPCRWSPTSTSAACFLEDEKCSICEGVCKNKAIDLHQKAEKQVVKVGAIVLSPGYGVFDPAAAGRLRLRDDRERGDQPRLRAAAVRHRAARGRDPAPLRQRSTRTRSPGSTASAPGRCSRAATATARRSAAPTSRSR